MRPASTVYATVIFDANTQFLIASQRMYVTNAYIALNMFQTLSQVLVNINSS